MKSSKTKVSEVSDSDVTKVDNIVKTELYLAKNNNDKTLIIAKSETGRTLLNALYNFSLSFEQYKLAKFLHNKKSTYFNDKKTQ